MRAPHSSYSTTLKLGPAAKVFINGDSTNQTVAPLFVDPAAGDFRQTPGSPTIDAGVTDAANGVADLDGDPRAILTTDIGADEYLPPFARVMLAGQTVRVRGTTAPVRAGCPAETRAGCPAETVPPCEGTLVLTARVGGKTLTLGRAAFTIQPGEIVAVAVKLSAKAVKLLGSKKTLGTTGTASATDGAGTAATSTARIKLKR